MRPAKVLDTRGLLRHTEGTLLALFIVSPLLAARSAHAETPTVETTAAAPTAQPLERIEVTGNTRTHPDIILRALGVKEGDPVSPEDVPGYEASGLHKKVSEAA